MGLLTGKTAIITGAARGIGKAIALKFAAEGANIAFTDLVIDENGLNTEKEIAAFGVKAKGYASNAANFEDTEKVVNQIKEEFGSVDILVNNAGVQYQQKSLLDISDEQFDYTMKTNMYSIFYLTRSALKHMCPGASIINVSSVTTFYGEPELIDYVTTKGAIVGFTRSLARNLALKNIRVNAIAPGFFWTPLQPACWQKEKIPSLGADAAMARGAMPYELAPTFVFLASEDSSYVTGQVIHNNGVLVMG